MKPTETMVLRFEDDHHQNLHRVLLDAGFTFQVSSDLQIGRRYVHPKKPLKVSLEDGDEDTPWLNCKIYFRDNIQTDDNYSKIEWDWMSAGRDTAENTIAMMQRELHILINIRPRYMTGEQIAAATSKPSPSPPTTEQNPMRVSGGAGRGA